ncbi:MAG: hypothetical protein JWP65_3625 [Ramlibacter sp.]|jgi:hypothetical protein|uniref:hypothetical protein n=1 Tax=Ramlibacter sp. TaxID=1917967 RepID=UPI002605E172|nr:hypothetical protein [Ramlibacter sp.]MDB5753204.1 hypothetical protein [Ramlibacter sp.]
MESLLGISNLWFTLCAAVFGIVLLIAWIILPFALIGTRGILHDILAESKRQTAILQAFKDGQPPP